MHYYVWLIGMKKKTLLVVGVIFFGSYTVLGAMNYVPLPGNLNPIYMYPGSQQDPNLEKTIEPLLLEYFQGAVTPEMITDAKKDIDWDVYGIDDADAQHIYDWFYRSKLDEGWSYYKAGVIIEDDFTAYWQGWTKVFMAHAIVIVEGGYVQNETQYNVVVGSFIAPYTAFLKYDNLLP
jgi:hypothetical protein